ncbi:MAG: hypothetical protein ONB54_01835 [candidate division KSB1 bacterium]|nr:hypothetical protein [candidate division KSB1 bacterium]MDZ7297207.1 hypothetical protein [candidate division KSB1 bacterium]MDZ7348074.1 hypothetical protein [candidate division KSB1 bacterium]MDZ7354536.1 hypothetical protein [candidate division KSB1 bacterium]MDZ7381660.1 hypothetical protein [candidate division KSB1 bacterium]
MLTHQVHPSILTRWGDKRAIKPATHHQEGVIFDHHQIILGILRGDEHAVGEAQVTAPNAFQMGYLLRTLLESQDPPPRGGNGRQGGLRFRLPSHGSHPSI